MTCPQCGSNYVNVQAITDVETKHRGCLSWLCWVLLGYLYSWNYPDYPNNHQHKSQNKNTHCGNMSKLRI